MFLTESDRYSISPPYELAVNLARNILLQPPNQAQGLGIRMGFEGTEYPDAGQRAVRLDIELHIDAARPAGDGTLVGFDVFHQFDITFVINRYLLLCRRGCMAEEDEEKEDEMCFHDSMVLSSTFENIGLRRAAHGDDHRCLPTDGQPVTERRMPTGHLLHDTAGQ